MNYSCDISDLYDGKTLVEKTLSKYFKFDKIFNLFPYGCSLSELKEDLIPLCKEKYENNYRFIFLHYDTDYHITNDQPGIILRNLQRILFSLGIPNYFVLVISQKNLQSHLDLLHEQETNDTCAITCLTHPLEENTHYKKINTDYNDDKIVCKFMSLNRVTRFHRTLLYALLKHEDLLKHGSVSYGNKPYTPMNYRTLKPYET